MGNTFGCEENGDSKLEEVLFDWSTVVQPRRFVVPFAKLSTQIIVTEARLADLTTPLLHSCHFARISTKLLSSPDDILDAQSFFDQVSFRGLIDSSDLYPALICISQGTIEEKMTALFDLFSTPIQGLSRLTESGFTQMLEKLTKYLPRMCTGLPSLSRSVARRWKDGIKESRNRWGMDKNRVDEGEWTKTEFDLWWNKDFHVRRFLQIFELDQREEEASFVNILGSACNHDALVETQTSEAQKLTRFRTV